MSTILVTGASGFVGQHLLDLLLEGRASVHAWRRPAAVEPLRRDYTAASVVWREVDVLDRDAVEAAIAEEPPDVVYHLAGAAQVASSWERVEGTLAVNVIGTLRVLDALRSHAPGARVLLPCSALVYRPSAGPLAEDSPIGPASPYGLSKLAQELLGASAHRDDDQPVLIARAFNHIGPGQSPSFFAAAFARQIAEIERKASKGTILVGNLDAARDLTDVRDTVKAYRALAAEGEPGQAYNVCSGRLHRVGDILEGLVARARVPIEVVVDPSRLRPNDNPVVLGDATRLRAATGWRPQISIERTLDDLMDDWRRRLGDACAC